jgi:hypothetical protein
MWPSEEFDTIRWLLAAQTERLLAYPVSGKVVAPSVLPSTTATSMVNPKTSSPERTDAYSGGVEPLDLGNDFADWKSGTAEGKADILEAAGHGKKNGLRWIVTIDHQNDGGEGGKYPVGWPRLGRNFKPGELDLTSYDMLEIWIRIDSSRDEVTDDHTPIGLGISSHNKKSTLYGTTVDLGDQQRAWIPLRFPLKKAISASDGGLDAWKSISRIQLHISEQNYAHGTRLIFDIGEVSIVRFKTPILTAIEVPHHILLPRKILPIHFSIFGPGASANDPCTIVASLESGGVSRAELRQNLAEPYNLALPLPIISPGVYTLKLTILNANGKQCSDFAREITAHAGPLY